MTSKTRTLLHCIGLWILLAPQLAWACKAWQPTAQPTDPQTWQQEYQRLQPLFAACLSDADFLAYYGAVQLRNGRYSDALDTLERALLLNPHNGTAQLDYAEALYFTGDPFAAQSLNQNLLQQNNLPPAVKQRLHARQQQFNRLFNRWSHQLSLSSGYDTNLNAAPDISDLTLTLGGQQWLMPLAPGNELRSGALLRLGAHTRYTRQQAHSQHTTELGYNSRWSEHREDRQQQLNASHQRRDQLYSGIQLQHGISLAALQLGDQHIYNEADIHQQIEWGQHHRCQLLPQHRLAYHHFPGQSLQNALEYRLQPEISCSQGQAQITLTAGLLLNHALHSQRPGGDRLGADLNLRWQQPLLAGRIILQARYSQLQDQQGYSYLLQDGARRRIQRNQLSAAYLQPLSPDLLLSLQAGLQQQRSNLQLFEYQSRQIEAGIRWQF